MKMQVYAAVAIVCLRTIGLHAAPETTLIRRSDSLQASAVGPQYCDAEHNVGNLVLGISNRGMFGSDYSEPTINCFTGEPVHDCQFPKGSGAIYLWAGFPWIGGIVNGDTLVSTAFEGYSGSFEFFPDQPPYGQMLYRSTISPEAPLRADAVSHQDFIASYFDTCTNCPRKYLDPTDKRYHKPIGLRIDQRSYAWDYFHAENAVIITYTVTNIGPNIVHNTYVGVCVDADVAASNMYGGGGDDIVGFIDSTGMQNECATRVRLPIGWICDNEGECNNAHILSPHVTGAVVLTSPGEGQHLSFNWWCPSAYNGPPSFGPMRKSIARDFGADGIGMPYGDKNKYYLLSNGDIDFNQPFTGKILPTDSVWVSPGTSGGWYAQGSDVRYLLSIGPWELAPGEQAEIAIAYVGGYNLHTTWGNEANLPSRPDIYMNWLNFSDLEKNALNAKWIYDNPGVDTDSDGYAGNYTICADDTVWFEGDGVPDLKADWPPPAPVVTVTPIGHGAVVRWNGRAAEERINWFSKLRDFEGYQVLLKNADSTSWDSVASYDIEDYLRVHWDTTMARWETHEYPYTLDSLRHWYAPHGAADTDWNPLRFTPLAPYSPFDFPDSLIYFAPVGCNASAFGHDTHIRKVYPEAARPPYAHPTDVPTDSVDHYLTPEGHFKFYEYELRIDNLVPSDSYAVAVVALSTGRASLNGFNPLPSEIASVAFVPLSDSNCCIGFRGNVDCDSGEIVDIADLIALIDNLYTTISPPCCVNEANVDGDPSGLVDISDLTRLIDFLYISLSPVSGCP